MKTTTNKINENSYTSPNCGTSTLIREESGDHIMFEETLPGTQGPEMPYLDGSLWNIPGYPHDWQMPKLKALLLYIQVNNPMLLMKR